MQCQKAIQIVLRFFTLQDSNFNLVPTMLIHLATFSPTPVDARLRVFNEGFIAHFDTDGLHCVIPCMWLCFFVQSSSSSCFCGILNKVDCSDVTVFLILCKRMGRGVY